MKKGIGKLLSLGVSLVGLAGCVPEPQTIVTFNSEPPGARMYFNQQLKGYAPLTLYYNSADIQRCNGNLGNVKAYWNNDVSLGKRCFISPRGGTPSPLNYAGQWFFLFERPAQRIWGGNQQQQQQQQTVIINNNNNR